MPTVCPGLHLACLLYSFTALFEVGYKYAFNWFVILRSLTRALLSACMYTPASSAFAALVARKGGGGGHSSSHSSSSDGESSSHPATGENDSGQASSDSKPHIPVTVSGSSKEMVAYGGGGGKSTRIPGNAPFAGRYEGGGTRAQVFGTRCVVIIPSGDRGC